MCVSSMVMDHYGDKWEKLRKEMEKFEYTYPTPIIPQPHPSPILLSELEELKILLEKAREYDKKNNQPDCGLDEKKERLRKLAEELGVKIDFIDEEAKASEVGS